MNKFPIYDLDDQGPNSKARRIIAISATLEGTCLFLDSLIEKLGDEEMLEDDRTAMRDWIEDRLKTIADLISGKILERPKPSDFATDVTA